jgi:hypothetical protein
MAYVFELDRHGARAPTGTNLTLEFYPVAEGILTPEGKRQRMLLGKYNR